MSSVMSSVMSSLSSASSLTLYKKSEMNIVRPKSVFTAINLAEIARELEVPSMRCSLNLNAKPFYPPGHQENLEKLKLEKIEEDKYFDQLENVWWEQNKNMFKDSLNDSKCLLRNMAKQEIKLKPITLMTVIVEEKIEIETVSSPSWADIVKK